MVKLNKELEKENMLDRLEGKPQRWKVIVNKEGCQVCGLYKDYIGWGKEELAEIRIKFKDDDDD